MSNKAFDKIAAGLIEALAVARGESEPTRMTPMSDQAGNVIPISGHMSREQYEMERAELRATYGDNNKQAGAKRDQALAALFFRSGWTQEELAQTEGVKQPYIARKLLFGRFLNFMPMGINSDSAAFLSERAFRALWDRTDKDEGNERIRFTAVLKLLAEVHLAAPRRPPIGDELVHKFADGEWHSIETIAKHLNADLAHVAATLSGIEGRPGGQFGATAEHRPYGKTTQHRLFKQQHPVDVDEIAVELTPMINLLQQLDAWLKEARKTDEKRRMHLKPGNYYQGCIYAWNAFREEKPIKDIRYKVDKGFLPLTH